MNNSGMLFVYPFKIMFIGAIGGLAAGLFVLIIFALGYIIYNRSELNFEKTRRDYDKIAKKYPISSKEVMRTYSKGFTARKKIKRD
jgi:hypothetical protein